jgi:non-specific serine/threonine protein kinase
VAKELPSREEFIAWAEMGESQRRLYNRICLAAREKIAQSIDTLGVGRSAMHVFEAMLRLRQAAIDPRLLGEEYARTASAKFDLFASRLEDALAEGHKILVFSQFVTVLEYIKIYLESLSVRYAMLHGKTVKRHDVIKEFQQDPEIRVFLLSLKAGGVGINLTAADYVILFDPWWNPAVEAQAVDRSHRIGQDKPVIVYRMVVKDSIEEKILILQQRKKALADGLIGEDAGLFRTLTREDILGLFEEIPAEGEYESSHQPI